MLRKKNQTINRKILLLIRMNIKYHLTNANKCFLLELQNKMSFFFLEQYESFVKFTQDQIMRRYGARPASCEYCGFPSGIFLLLFSRTVILIRPLIHSRCLLSSQQRDPSFLSKMGTLLLPPPPQLIYILFP